ncbi:MAG: hypothetical protein KQH79_07775 [Bacteroidetes bacterium]|nr:hypothetical protein [Bacteroidota bacterium]
MNSSNLKYIFLLLISCILIGTAYSQENSIKNCDNYLGSGFVSDGQEYIAKPDENNRAKFYTTFYGGSQYRLIACSDTEKYPLIMSLYDTEKNLLFCNSEHDYTPYWNFTFTSTIDCIIELEFDTNEQLTDEVMLLIGFKEK